MMKSLFLNFYLGSGAQVLLNTEGTPPEVPRSTRSTHLPSPRAPGEAMEANIVLLLPTCN